MSEKTNRTLACDVGYRNFAWILFDQFDTPISCGCIHTDSGVKARHHLKRCKGESQTENNARVCQFLARELDEIRRWAQPTRIVLESPSGGSQGARAGACMSMALAVAAVVFRQCECHWETPKRTKDKAVAACLEAWPSFEWPEAVGDSEHVFDAGSCFLLFREKQLLAEKPARQKND